MPSELIAQNRRGVRIELDLQSLTVTRANVEFARAKVALQKQLRELEDEW